LLHACDQHEGPTIDQSPAHSDKFEPPEESICNRGLGFAILAVSPAITRRDNLIWKLSVTIFEYTGKSFEYSTDDECRTHLSNSFRPIDPNAQIRKIVRVMITRPFWTDSQIQEEYKRHYPDDPFQVNRPGGFRNQLQRFWPMSAVYQKERDKAGRLRAPLLAKSPAGEWRLAPDWQSYLPDLADDVDASDKPFERLLDAAQVR
jgi:hypothetical protein